ncbi:MAG TPA: flagellar export chaperone FliS [Azoarcus taiwanensis]|nr:flagellar export chaperone FliS [Azoarcus taiwanensis]
MFGTTQNRASAYAKVGVETSVSTADPHKLILMLYDGALMAIATAKQAIGAKNVAGKGKAISKAIEIIASGLDASLDHDAGGELAGRLSSLYDYMIDRLLYANIHDSTAALEEVAELIGGLRESWETIGTQVRTDLPKE